MPSIQELLQLFSQGGAGGMQGPMDPRLAALQGMAPGGGLPMSPGGPPSGLPPLPPPGAMPPGGGGMPLAGPPMPLPPRDSLAPPQMLDPTRGDDEADLEAVQDGMGADEKPTQEEITAALNDPAARQAFIEKYGDEPEAFDNPEEESNE